MAALTSSNVRTIKAWTEGGTNGKRRKVRMVEVFGGSWGGTSNTMPATAFGLSVVEEASLLYYGANSKYYPLAPNSDGSTVYAYTSVGGTPADLTLATTTGGGYFTVKGY